MDNNLIIKNVDFQGSDLMAVQDKETKKIFVGVSYICKGIGLSRGQKNRQVLNIQEDLVLKQGCIKFGAGVFDENNDTLAIDIDFLPLWLAKINITPKMKDETPVVANNLIEYQLKAKDVLAEAFIEKVIPKTLQEALRDYADTLDKLEVEKEKNKELQPKADNFDLFMNSKSAMDMGNFAKAIKVTKNDKLIGRNTLFKYLRDKEILMDKNIPYQRFIQQKLFEVITVVKYDKNFNKTLVTPKGAEYIIKKLREDNYIVNKNEEGLV